MEGLVTYLDLFMILRRSENYNNSLLLFETVLSRLNYDLSNHDRQTLQEYFRRFCQAIMKRWRSANRKFDIFLNKYEVWLQSDIDWPKCIENTVVESLNATEREPEMVEPQPSTSSVGVGTTRSNRKSFEALGVKQKKRRTEQQLDLEVNELAYTTARKLREEGRNNFATVIEHLLKHPEAADQIVDLIKDPSSKPALSPEKALGLLVSLRLSKWQYMTLRENVTREGLKDLYPSYYKIQLAKSQCYPPKESITVSDITAKIKLQSLLDHTVERILKSLPESFQGLNMRLISKWGFDGASNQSRYKQAMESEADDASIFMTSLVPLKLTTDDGIGVWQNPKPCSVSFCRPVQFSFIKESETVVTQHLKDMEDEVKALVPTKFNENTINHELMMTMIDGKVCTYISDARSNATCYLCLAKPSEMNDLEKVSQKPLLINYLKFRLSPLHARINCMECLLRIAYKQDLKKWSVKGNEDKSLLEAKKKVIQDRFKTELNLLIDIVKQGSGTTNDGNTARKFFQNPAKTAAITGLDEELIKRFSVLLQAITSGESINVPKFHEYAMQTAKRYIELYKWYYMSATIHKILVHGADIISNNAVAPIGTLSEEASESRNKDFLRFREHHSRKSSRVNCNEDVFNTLLVTSDPLISSKRPTLDISKSKDFFTETLDLLTVEAVDTEFVDVSGEDFETDLILSESEEDLL